MEPVKTRKALASFFHSETKHKKHRNHLNPFAFPGVMSSLMSSSRD